MGTSLDRIRAQVHYGKILAFQSDPSLQIKKDIKLIEESENEVIEILTSLASIVSPSGQEYDRALFVADYMKAIGLQDVYIDSVFNVVGKIKGRSNKALVFITMLDDLPEIGDLQKKGNKPYLTHDKVVGPATEIQSMTASSLLSAKILVKSGKIPENDIIFASVSQEETGLGGMKVLFESM